jgi:hypothetical protein
MNKASNIRQEKRERSQHAIQETLQALENRLNQFTQNSQEIQGGLKLMNVPSSPTFRQSRLHASNKSSGNESLVTIDELKE